MSRRNRRVRFYRDAACNIPIDSKLVDGDERQVFDFGELDAGQTMEAVFYVRNVGMVTIEDVLLTVVPLSHDLIVELLTDKTIPKFKPLAVHGVRVRIQSYESAEAGKAQFNVEMKGKISSE